MPTNALKDVLPPVNCIWLWDSSRACLNLKIIELKPLSVQEKRLNVMDSGSLQLKVRN